MSVIFNNLFKNRIVKNFIVVFLGDGLSSILSLINLSIMIRVLGFNDSSLVNLAMSYILVFDTIFNFQSFNSIIKFLPNFIVSKDNEKVASLIRQGFILDITTSILSFTLSNISINFISSLFNWDSSLSMLIRIYSFFILFNITGTCIGVVRVFDKFKYSSYINAFVSFMKFIMYGLSFIIKVNMIYFIGIEVIFTLISTILMFILTFKIFKDNKIKNIFRLRNKWDREFLKFNFYCNFMTTLDLPISHLTPFLINRFIGLEFISVYKVIEKIGGIVSKVSSPLVNIIYPEISMKISENNTKYAFSLVKKLFIFIFMFGSISIIGVSFTYKLWINILILNGERFVQNIILYLLFVVIKFAFVGVYPLFISLGYIKYNIPIVIVSNLIYLICIPMLTPSFNINGIIFAQFIQATLVIFMQIFIIKYNYKAKNI